MPDKTPEEQGYEFLKNQFISHFTGKRLYPFKTCAIDKDNCCRVFKSIKDSVMSACLGEAGI